MSQACAIASCDRLARVICHCCQQNLCIIHLDQHNYLLNSQLHPLIDSVAALVDHLKSLNFHAIARNYRTKLDRWRSESHEKIDILFGEKCQELDRFLVDKVEEQRENALQLQSKINALAYEQQVTQQDILELTSMRDQLERELNNIHNDYVQIYTQPLSVDNSLIKIKGNNENEYDLTVLSSIYKMINRPSTSYGALACNERYLLIHQTPHLCLVDRDLEIIQRIPWHYGIIHDICWSNTLNRFIVLDSKHIYFIDESNMFIEKIQTIEKRKWLSCTCSHNYLFLSTNEWGSSITKIYFNQSRKIDRQWQSPDICKKDEYIDTISTNKKKLAILIRNVSNKTLRIELRSTEDLECIWAVVLDVPWSPHKPFHCCPFVNDDWLVTDYVVGRLLHVSKTGRIKSTIPYNSMPYYATMFGSSTLVISSKEAVNFHNLNYKKTYTIFVV